MLARTERVVIRFFALLLTLTFVSLPVPALADGLEVIEVRADNYPRMIVRFVANEPDGAPISALKPGQLQVWENGVAQQQVDFYSLRESSPELWVSLVVDVSGSMNDDNKLAQAKEAAKAFVSRLRAKDRTSIVTFSDRVILQQQPTGDLGILKRAIDSLQAKGPTRMNDGLSRGISEVLRGREGSRRAVILLTDGEDTDSETELATAVGPALESKVPVYTIGLGSDARTEVLQGIARDTRARYYAAPRAGDLDYVFKRLSGQLSNQYEAWWQSTTVTPSGSQVEGRLLLQPSDSQSVEASFSYVMPVIMKPLVREERSAVGSLKEVELPVSTSWWLPNWWPLAASGLAGLGVYLAYHGLVIRLTRTRLQQRLQHYVGDSLAEGPRQARPKAAPRQAMRPVILSLARVSHRMMPTRMLDDLRHRLVLAGRPTNWHFAQFLSTKLLLAGALGAVAYMVTAASTHGNPLGFIAMIGSLGVLGYYVPHFWLAMQIKARQKQIQRALPDALDLLTVGVGAGLSLDGAVLELCNKSDSPLSRELANFLAELRMGRTRREALQGLTARTEVEDIKILVASLLQAEELGMSLSDTLMIQADQMRLRRRQRAEEQAHKATIKMMFPMVGLIFPALFVVIMGPAVPSLLSFMNGGGGT